MQADQLEQLGVNHVAQYYKPPPAPAGPAARSAAPAGPAAGAVPDDDGGGGGFAGSAAAEPGPGPVRRAPGVTRISTPSALRLIRPKGACTCVGIGSRTARRNNRLAPSAVQSPCRYHTSRREAQQWQWKLFRDQQSTWSQQSTRSHVTGHTEVRFMCHVQGKPVPHSHMGRQTQRRWQPSAARSRTATHF